MTYSTDRLRSCAGCSAHILTCDGASDKVYCTPCRPKHVISFDDWAAKLQSGDRVYVQPYIDPAFARSTWIIRELIGDSVRISVLGLPDRVVETTISQLASECMIRSYQ